MQSLKIILIVFLSLTSFKLQAEDFQRFDGQMYNGLYYPRMNALEWAHKGESLHLEFQIYKKDAHIEVSGFVDESRGSPVFVAAIDLKYRNERRCRRVVAPPSFKQAQKLYYYLDTSDKDMNNFIVSSEPLKNKQEYHPKKMSRCAEVAAHSQEAPEAQKRALASTPPINKGSKSAIISESQSLYDPYLFVDPKQFFQVDSIPPPESSEHSPPKKPLNVFSF